MRLSGLLFMLVSWVSILSLFFYCLYRTLKSGGSEPNDSSDSNDIEGEKIEAPKGKSV